MRHRVLTLVDAVRCSGGAIAASGATNEREHAAGAHVAIPTAMLPADAGEHR